MFAIPALTSEYVRKIAETANCRIYAPCDTFIYGDTRFLGIFAHNDIEGFANFDEEYYDIIKKEYVSGKTSLNLKKGNFIFCIKKTVYDAM